MKRHQLNKHWDVIKAFKDGKEIQILINGKWYDLGDDISFDAFQILRVKPETGIIPFDYSDNKGLIKWDSLKRCFSICKK